MGIPVPPSGAGQDRQGALQSLRCATGNNLKNVSVDVPLGLFVAITGVSGGGKSTLMIDTMYQAIARG
jgi:excinuclease ABC subunit A